MVSRSTLTLGATSSEIVQQGVVQLKYIPTEEQETDILMKALGKIKFTYFKGKMGMVKNPFQ